MRVPHKRLDQKIEHGYSKENPLVLEGDLKSNLLKGKIPNDWWEGIGEAYKSSIQYVGYPTQKPLALLERIIKASSNQGDTILDPFCGCATTCVAAEKLGRQWLGIDLSPKAVELARTRLQQLCAVTVIQLDNHREICYNDIYKSNGGNKNGEFREN